VGLCGAADNIRPERCDGHDTYIISVIVSTFGEYFYDIMPKEILDKKRSMVIVVIMYYAHRIRTWISVEMTGVSAYNT